MTSDEIIEALLEIGVPGKLVAEIAKKLFTSEANEAAWEASRAVSRASSQRYRDKQKLLVTSRDVTSCHVTSRDVSLEASLCESNTNGKKHKKATKSVIREEEVSKKEEERYMRAKKLADDFIFSDADHQFAEKHGWDLARRLAELERFKDHAKATGRRQVDWHAAWRSWVTSPYNDRKGTMNGHHQQKPQGLVAAADELLAELRARREAGRISDDGGQASFLGIQDRRNH